MHTLQITTKTGYSHTLQFSLSGDSIEIIDTLFDSGPYACLPSGTTRKKVGKDEARIIWKKHITDGYRKI